MRRLLTRAAWLVALVLMHPVSARADATVLVPLSGPLSLRLDYRLFLLGEVSKEEVGAIAPGTKHPQRIAAGIHFDF